MMRLTKKLIITAILLTIGAGLFAKDLTVKDMLYIVYSEITVEKTVESDKTVRLLLYGESIFGYKRTMIVAMYYKSEPNKMFIYVAEGPITDSLANTELITDDFNVMLTNILLHRENITFYNVHELDDDTVYLIGYYY